ncbi:TOMM precursor leader peptide-binding protein [Amycolatopsis coloradensis]|uniref:TOMM leader peptide-binding protein n=1 Tax=Amycolatopsis coloradensis TaxID=76021 RepID=A0ACD5BDM6_9PSEU
MNPVIHTTPHGAGLWLYGAGAFGERVLGGLDDRRTGRLRLLAGVTQTARLGLFETVAARAGALRLPWLPLVLDGTTLYCGPVTGAGTGPCPDCAGKRRRQHSQRARLSALPAPAEEHAFLPEHGKLAIALLHAVTRAFTDDGETADIHEIDLVHGTYGKHRVIPVHGCPGCDPPGSADRSWERLAAGLGIRTEVAG